MVVFSLDYRVLEIPLLGPRQAVEVTAAVFYSGARSMQDGRGELRARARVVKDRGGVTRAALEPRVWSDVPGAELSPDRGRGELRSRARVVNR